MMRTSILVAGTAIVAGLLAVACGPSTGDNIVNAAPDPAAVLHAQEVLRIGRTDGTGPDVFGRVNFVKVDQAGRIYVADGMAQEIRVFDAVGRYVRTIGRAGEGPGEFLYLAGMAFDRGGLAWVWDTRQQRLTAFDTAGQLVRDTRREFRTALLPWAGQFAADGELLDISVELRGLNMQKHLTQEFQTATRVVRFSRQFEPLDSQPPLLVKRTAIGGNIAVPFEGGMVSALEPTGTTWSTHGPEYRVIRTNAEGDTTLTFSLAVPPVPVTEAERDSVSAAMHLPRSMGTMDPDLIPRAKPAIVRLVPMGSGWIGVFPELGPGTGRYLDVFAPTGVHKARVDLGTRLLVKYHQPEADGGRLYGVTTDEWDVPFVVVLALGIPELGEAG